MDDSGQQTAEAYRPSRTKGYLTFPLIFLLPPLLPAFIFQALPIFLPALPSRPPALTPTLLLLLSYYLSTTNYGVWIVQ